jgi:Dolichyl-phosphate-mannose-protein mannosyltransferase
MRHKSPLSQGLFHLGLLILILSFFSSYSLPLLIIGAVLLTPVILKTTHPIVTVPWRSSIGEESKKKERINSIPAISVLVLVTGLNIASLFFFTPKYEDIFFGLWQLSLIILIVCWGLLHKEALKELFLFFTPLDWTLAITATCTALVLRLYFINEAPLTHFEGVWGLNVLRLMEGEIKSPFHWIGDFPSNLPSYPMSWFLFLLPKDPIFALRLPHAICGALCAFFLYAICKNILKDTAASILASFALAFSAWAINEGIYASNFSMYELLQLIVITFVFVSHNRALSNFTAILGGIACGLLFDMLYSQTTTIIVVGIVFLPVIFSIKWEKYRTAIVQPLLFLYSFLLSVSPTILRLIFEHPFPFARHLQALALDQTTGLAIHGAAPSFLDVLRGAAKFFRIYFIFPSDSFSGGQEYWPPVLDYALDFLFLLGLYFCFLHIRRKIPFFLVSLGLLMYFPFLLRPSSYYRLHATLPVVFIFIPIATSIIWHELAPSFSRKSFHTLQVITVTLLLAYTGIANFNYMQRAMVSKGNRTYGNGENAASSLGNELMRLSHECSPYISKFYARSIPMQFFIAKTKNKIKWFSDINDLPLAVENDLDLCLFMGSAPEEEPDRKIVTALKYYYGKVHSYTLSDTTSHPSPIRIYIVKKADLLAKRGLMSTSEVLEFVNGQVPQCKACSFSGSLVITQSGLYSFRPVGMENVLLSLNDKKINLVDNEKLYLFPGPYKVTLDFTKSDTVPARLVTVVAKKEFDSLLLKSLPFPDYPVQAKVIDAAIDANFLLPLEHSLSNVIDSDHFPMTGPLTLEKVGTFTSTVEGTYRFKVMSSFEVKLFLDGKEILNYIPGSSASPITSALLKKDEKHTISSQTKFPTFHPAAIAYSYVWLSKPGIDSYEDIPDSAMILVQ